MLPSSFDAHASLEGAPDSNRIHRRGTLRGSVANGGTAGGPACACDCARSAGPGNETLGVTPDRASSSDAVANAQTAESFGQYGIDVTSSDGANVATEAVGLPRSSSALPSGRTVWDGIDVNPDQVLVEFGTRENIVPIRVALDVSSVELSAELGSGAEHTGGAVGGDVSFPAKSTTGGGASSGSASGAISEEAVPVPVLSLAQRNRTRRDPVERLTSEVALPSATDVLGYRQNVDLLIAVASDCCSERSAARRESIRATWARSAASRTDAKVRVRFFLAQPRDAVAAKLWLPRLAAEAKARGDITFVRGADTYRALPNKTLRILRYANASGNSHVLKTDDDCYVRVAHLLDALRPWSAHRPEARPDVADTRMARMYLGGVENAWGFRPVRDFRSKWYIARSELADEDLPIGSKYIAGWGYILSSDVAAAIVGTVDAWSARPESAPRWFGRLDWEDVVVGAIAATYLPGPERHGGFQSAWQRCASDAVVRHLDVDAPRLMAGLYEQDISGLWDQVTIRCSSGKHMPGNYAEWRAWRNSLEGVTPL